MGTIIDLLLRNVTLPDGRIADISIDKGIVVHVGAGKRAEEVVDCRQMLCLPGAIDMHVHMRGGNQGYKEDWESGSRSAIAGGVTLVVDQPNTIPPISTAGRFRERIEEASKESLCHFAVNGGVFPGSALEEMWEAGAMAFGEIFTAASSYGDAIRTEELRNALQRIQLIGGVATIHAEEVTQGADNTLAAHDALRPETGEATSVASISALIPGGSRIHFCHMSNSHSIDMAQGTVEVTPHHLFLSLDDFEPEDGRGKVNPPIRNERTRKKIWSRWERIDVIASDHAPHTIYEKSEAFGAVPSGIPGVETMLPLLLAEVVESRISLQSVIEKTVYNPAAILGIPSSGFEVGNRADFGVYPRIPIKIDAESLHSKAGWTPFEGKRGVFPETVIVAGAVTYDSEEFFSNSAEWIPGRGYKSKENYIL